MIAWIFSRDCAAISPPDKVKVLFSWFGLSEPSNDEIHFSTTEVGRVDILIGTTHHLFVIENKLKSSVHSNQLSRYSEYLQNSKFEGQGKKTLYRLLSLVGEDASLKEAPSAWKNTSYEEFLSALRISKRKLGTNDSVIMAEYEKTLAKQSSIALATSARAHTYLRKSSPKATQKRRISYSCSSMDKKAEAPSPTI